MAAAAVVVVAPGRAVAQAPEEVERADADAKAAVAADVEQTEEREADATDTADEGAAAAEDPLPDEAADGEPVDEEPAPEEPEVDPTDVTDAGVPDAPVEPDKAVAEVEKAVQQVEEAVQKAEESRKDALPGEYTIEFGDTFDWLRLSSGEWLKGEFQWMRDDQFGFDSSDLDVVTDDWEKVARLHSPRVHTYAFLDGTDLIGRAVITPDQIIVETVDGVVTMPRSELLGVIDGGRRERDFWYLRIGVGFSSSIGNTSQGSLNGDFELGRADQRSVAKLTYDGTVGYADREETVNRHIGRADYRIFLTKRYYVVPVTGEFFNDRFANIRIRANPAVAGGVHLFDTSKVEWDTELSLGYQYLRYLSTIDGVPNPQSDFFIGFLNVWSFDLGALDLDLSWQTALVVSTIGNTNHQGSAVISVEITEILDLDATFNFYRTEQPGPRSDGTVPQKNDYQFVVGLTLEIG